MDIGGKHVPVPPIGTTAKQKDPKLPHTRHSKPFVNWKRLPWGQEPAAKKHDCVTGAESVIKRHNLNNVTTYNRIPIPKLDLSWVDNPDHSLDTPVDVRCPKEKLPDPKCRRKWSDRSKSGEKDIINQPLVDASPTTISEEGNTFLTIRPMDRKILPPLTEKEREVPSKFPQHGSNVGGGKELLIRKFQTGAKGANFIRLPKLEGGLDAAKCTLQAVRPKSGKPVYERKPLSGLKARGDGKKVHIDVKPTPNVNENEGPIKHLQSGKADQTKATSLSHTEAIFTERGSETPQTHAERRDNVLPQLTDIKHDTLQKSIARGDTTLQNGDDAPQRRTEIGKDAFSKRTESRHDTLPKRTEIGNDAHSKRTENRNDIFSRRTESRHNALPKRTESGNDTAPKCTESVNDTAPKRTESGDDTAPKRTESGDNTFLKHTESQHDVLPKSIESGDGTILMPTDREAETHPTHTESEDDTISNTVESLNDTLPNSTKCDDDTPPQGTQLTDHAIQQGTENEIDSLPKPTESENKIIPKRREHETVVQAKRTENYEKIQSNRKELQSELDALKKEEMDKPKRVHKVPDGMMKTTGIIRAQSDTITHRQQKEKIYPGKRSKSDSAVKIGFKGRTRHETPVQKLTLIAKEILQPVPLQDNMPSTKTPLPDIPKTRPESPILTTNVEEKPDIQMSQDPISPVSPVEVTRLRSALAGTDISIPYYSETEEDEELPLVCETICIPIEPEETLHLESLQRELTQRHAEVDHYFQEQIVIDSSTETILESAEKEHANLMAVNAVNREMESTIKVLQSEMYETKMDAKNYEISLQREMADYDFLMNLFGQLKNQIPKDFKIKIHVPAYK